MATRGLPAWPYTDAEAEALPAPERLLIDTARSWAAEARAGHPPLPAMRRLLACESAQAAAAPLDALLQALATAHPITLGCPLCPRLVGEEPPLLLAVGLAQHGPRREALACLLSRMPNAEAYAATAIATGCAFRAAGLMFGDPWRPRIR